MASWDASNIFFFHSVKSWFVNPREKFASYTSTLKMGLKSIPAISFERVFQLDRFGWILFCDIVLNGLKSLSAISFEHVFKLYIKQGRFGRIQLFDVLNSFGGSIQNLEIVTLTNTKIKTGYCSHIGTDFNFSFLVKYD